MNRDPYQEGLLTLILSGLVQAYGGNWDRVGVRAYPLSYRQANHVLASASCCFGLMWPYQRGKTLSGRMWQAPLNGCFVISEKGTNILGCPGVVERDAFDQDTVSLQFSPAACRQLAHEAAEFWEGHTRALAEALGLRINLNLDGELNGERALLMLWDLEFRLQRLNRRFLSLVIPPFRCARRYLARLARLLGIHPRQLAERRGGP